jgi:hypothetical protein
MSIHIQGHADSMADGLGDGNVDAGAALERGRRIGPGQATV